MFRLAFAAYVVRRQSTKPDGDAWRSRGYAGIKCSAHAAALFDRRSAHRAYGSCHGHGGRCHPGLSCMLQRRYLRVATWQPRRDRARTEERALCRRQVTRTTGNDIDPSVPRRTATVRCA